MKFGMLCGLSGLVLSSAAHAEAAATCQPPPAFKAWNAPAASALEPGRSKEIALALTTKFRRTPGKLPVAGTYGGIVPMVVPKPGAYLIALDVPAWIDVVHGGTLVPSIDHSRAEACSGIHKIVRFPLMAGPYVIQISGSPSPKARIMIVPAD